MKALTLMGITVALALGASAVTATGSRVTGLVTAATDKSLQIMTDTREKTTVGVDDKTSYMPWVTHQPWQQGGRASRESVAVASCVDIELRSQEARVAKVVRINADAAKSIYDPCRAIR